MDAKLSTRKILDDITLVPTLSYVPIFVAQKKEKRKISGLDAKYKVVGRYPQTHPARDCVRGESY